MQRSNEQHARWLLAYSLDWHRRENKAVWWQYFRLSQAYRPNMLDERAALSGLTFVETVGGTGTGAHSSIYSFPPQNTDLRGDEDLVGWAAKNSARWRKFR